MLKKTLALLLLLTAGQLHASTFPVEIIEYIDDTKVVAFIYEKDIQRAPTWEPFESAPSIDIQGVVQKMQDFARSHTELADATFEEAELKQIPRHPKHWHYLVIMKTHGEDQAKLHYFVVLMDGKIIPALMEPAPLK